MIEFELTHRLYRQLEFSLLAIHDDPLPRLQEQIAQLQAAGQQAEASELMVKLANENAKRENWAVRLFSEPHFTRF